MEKAEGGAMSGGSASAEHAPVARAPSSMFLPEDYMESIATLPAELNKNLSLIQQMDERSEELLRGIEEKAGRAMRRGRKQPNDGGGAEFWSTVEGEESECRQMGDEKVALAEQTYELVDAHVQRLDQSLKRFEDELRRANPSIDFKLANLGYTSLSRVNGQAGDDMPVDPNEPVYCFCRKVSYGQMIACDSPDCKFEWFHYICVGLKEEPAGRWLCASCATGTDMS